MGRKRRKAPKILLHPMFRWIRGKMGKIVYRLSHNGEVSAYPAPDMSHVVRSPAREARRQKMAKQRKMYERRPFDVAVSDYHDGNDLLWQKFYGDREKPADWSWKDAQLPKAPVPGT
jgi:hypothetical protein